MSELANVPKPGLPTNLKGLLDLAKDKEGGLRNLNETDFAMIWTAIFGVGVWWALPLEISFGITVAASNIGIFGTIGMVTLGGVVGIMILTMISVIAAAALAGTANQSINLFNFLKLDGLFAHRETIMKSLWHDYYLEYRMNEFIFVSPQQTYPGIIIPLKQGLLKQTPLIKNENDQGLTFNVKPTRNDCKKEPEWYTKQIKELENKYERNFEYNNKKLKSLKKSSNPEFCVVLTNDQIDSILKHSFLDTLSFKDLFNRIAKKSFESICNTDDDSYFDFGQDFSYKVIKTEDNLTYLTGPICIGNLIKLGESEEIEINPYKDDKSPLVYLKENGWFSTCSNDGKHINCNPLKIKENKKCWTVSLRSNENDGFNFLDLVDAAEHDSYIASSCFYDELQNDFSGFQNTLNNFFADNQKNQNQKGGNLDSFNKYIKYKNKYLELKNSLKM